MLESYGGAWAPSLVLLAIVLRHAWAWRAMRAKNETNSSLISKRKKKKKKETRLIKTVKTDVEIKFVETNSHYKGEREKERIEHRTKCAWLSVTRHHYCYYYRRHHQRLLANKTNKKIWYSTLQSGTLWNKTKRAARQRCVCYCAIFFLYLSVAVPVHTLAVCERLSIINNRAGSVAGRIGDRPDVIAGAVSTIIFFALLRYWLMSLSFLVDAFLRRGS